MNDMKFIVEAYESVPGDAEQKMKNAIRTWIDGVVHACAEDAACTEAVMKDHFTAWRKNAVRALPPEQQKIVDRDPPGADVKKLASMIRRDMFLRLRAAI